MWMEKLFAGVLCVLTPMGPRYIKPSLPRRIYLLWIFRHFRVLPMQVLTTRQCRVMESLCAESRFVTPGSNGEEAPILGTLERCAPAASDRRTSNERIGDRISDAVPPFATEL